jgi:dCMP deaminase
MSWDKYFHKITEVVASNSKCLSRKIGAILVRDNVVICTGYNGPPRGVPHCEGVCPRRAKGYASGEGLHLCPAAHAERNCIAHAARLGITVKGATLYMNSQIPCKDCLSELINAGVAEVVCTSLEPYDEMSKFLLAHSDIRIRAFKEGVDDPGGTKLAVDERTPGRYVKLP